MLATKTVRIQTPDGNEVDAVRAVHGPDSITIKRLGWSRLEEAEKANQKAAIAHVRDLGGPAVIKEFQDAAKDAKKEGLDLREKLEAEVKRDPLGSYDKRLLLNIGIVEIDGVDHRATDADGQAKRLQIIEDFEPETAEACARAILKASRPTLFETEAEQKNG